MTEEKKDTEALELSTKQPLFIDGVMQRLFTVDDLNLWTYQKEYLVDILNGVYKVEDAQEDLYSLIDSDYDSRNGA